MDARTNRIYATNTDDNTVSVIDGSTNDVVANIAVGGAPIGIAVNPANDKIYVYNSSNHSVSIVDGATNNVIATPTVAINRFDTQIAIDPSNGNADLFSPGSPSFVVIGGMSNAAAPALTLGSSAQGVGFDPAEHRIYVSTLTGMSFIDETGATPAVTNLVLSTGTINNGFEPVVGPVTVDETTHAVYEAVNLQRTTSPSCEADVAGSIGEYDMYVIDGETDTVTTDDRCVETTGRMVSVAADPNTNRIFLAEATTPPAIDGAIGFFDEAANSVTRQIAVPLQPQGETPFVTLNEMVVNPGSGRLYYAQANDNDKGDPLDEDDATYVGGVAVIDASTGAQLPGSPFETGRQFGGFVVNPVANTLYALDNANGNLAVLQ